MNFFQHRVYTSVPIVIKRKKKKIPAQGRDDKIKEAGMTRPQWSR